MKGNGKLAKETHLFSTVSDDVQEAQAGSPLVGSNSLGPSALKTATQVKGQPKYLNDCLEKSNICAEEQPSVSEHLSYVLFVKTFMRECTNNLCLSLLTRFYFYCYFVLSVCCV